MTFEELKSSAKLDKDYLDHNLETLRKNYQNIINDKIKKFLDTLPVDTVFYKKAGHGYENELSYKFYTEDKVCMYSNDFKDLVTYDISEILDMEMGE